jgi:hypothetical protein
MKLVYTFFPDLGQFFCKFAGFLTMPFLYSCYTIGLLSPEQTRPSFYCLYLMASSQRGYGHRHSAYLADLPSPALAASELLRDHHI